MEGEKRKRRTVELIGYSVRINFESSTRDETDSWEEYYESESVSRVYKHLFGKYKPTWLYDNESNSETLSLFKSHNLMTESKLEALFRKVYSKATQSPDDDYNNKYYIEVEEYRTPHFEMV